MTKVDLTIDPYYDKFNASNNRTMVIFQKDKVVQTAELNEMQSIESYYLQTLGNSIMTDGDKQSGMSYSNKNNNITVSSGTVYLAGKVRPFTEQSVTIAGTGIETIGIKLNQTIITANDDNSLLNPAINTPGYQAVGANRLQETIDLVANDSSATTIYTFKDGHIYNIPGNPQLTKINNIVAQRTNDINGSFRVGSTGFEIHTNDDPKDSSKALLTIDAGLAYVQGKRINKIVPESMEVPKSLTTTTITDEETEYVSGNNKYELGYPNVATLTSVTGNVKQTSTVTKGSSQYDTLPFNNIISIDEVFTEGSRSVTYNKGTDYQLSGHTQIEWLPGGKAPSNGSSYRVTYTYNKVLVQGSDYTVTNSDNQTYIDFTGFGIIGSGDSNGGILVNNSNLIITYTYYLYRIDLITLSSSGNFSISYGKPDTAANVKPVESNDPTSLNIGLVYWSPNSSESSCMSIAPSNLTMDQLVKLKNTVVNTQFNQALNALNTVATASYDPTQLRGVFSDGFLSLDKADIGNPDYSVMMSYMNETVTPVFSTKTDNSLSIDTDNSNVVESSDGQYITAGYTEQNMISQPLASDAELLNEYSYYGKEGILKLDPSEDSWVNTSND